MVQEGLHLWPAHGVRVALAVEIEPPETETAAVFGAGTEMPAAEDDENVIKQARGCRSILTVGRLDRRT